MFFHPLSAFLFPSGDTRAACFQLLEYTLAVFVSTQMCEIIHMFRVKGFIMLRIKEAREARGWTQEQLAAAMNTTQQTIQRWESGQTDPKSSVIVEISRVLGITVSFIMNIEESDEVRLLSADEHELIDCYRSLPTKAQRALLAGLREYLQ